jgi:hypothetical protein
MSTGDQTEYVRRKAEERNRGRHHRSAQFMKSAFDEWAESERPARFGGAEKVPAVKQMPRRKNDDMSEAMEHHMHRHGKGFFSKAFSAVKSGVSSAVGAVTSAADTASKMTEFYNKAKEYAPRVKEALQSDMIPASYRPVATKLVEYMEMVGLGKHKKCPLARHIATECMHRHHSGMYGGASILSIATNAKKVYDWIKENSAAIHTILKLPQLEPYGGKIEGVMSMVGLGKRPSHKYIDAGVLFMDPVTGHHIIKKVRKSKTGGAWYSGLASAASKGISAAKNVASVASKAKQYLPMAEQLLAQYGGETGANIAAKIKGLTGVGRRRRGRGDDGRVSPYEDSDGRVSKDSSGPKSDQEIQREFERRMKAYADFGGTLSSRVANQLYQQVLAENGRDDSPPSQAEPEVYKYVPQKSLYEILKEQGTDLAKPRGKGGAGPKPMYATLRASGKPRAPNARNAIVKQVMMDQGLSLIEASKYVKEHGLYSPSR